MRFKVNDVVFGLLIRFGYKYIEVLQKSFGHKELAPPDCNMHNYSSKIDSTLGAFGVKFLYGLEYDYDKIYIPLWEKFAKRLSEEYNTDVGEVETCFCKFAKMNKGNYYVGYRLTSISC